MFSFGVHNHHQEQYILGTLYYINTHTHHTHIYIFEDIIP